MQTDPNPANYLYDTEKGVLNLIDFGAGRDYGTEFLGFYLELINGAKTLDRAKVMDNSLLMKMVTGEENREMEDTHYAGVCIVGEPFRMENKDDLYDFEAAGFTERVTKLLPTMSKHRLTPPP